MARNGMRGELVIDQLSRAAHERPHEKLLAGLSNAEAWARSGAVASWLIAQGYGPGGKALSVPAADRLQQVVILLGALRAGALVDETAGPVSWGAMANCGVDAAVAERRLHIDASTPARVLDGVLRRQGDFGNVADVLGGLK